MPGLGQQLALASGQRRHRARQSILQALERFQQPGLTALQEQERIDERAEPAGLDQRLARQAHQPREALGRHSHDAVGGLGRAGPGLGDAFGEADGCCAGSASAGAPARKALATG